MDTCTTTFAVSAFGIAPSNGINMENGIYTLHVNVSTTSTNSIGQFPAAAGALVTCQFAEPCGALVDPIAILLAGGMVIYDAYTIYTKSGSKPNAAACQKIVQAAKNQCTNSYAGGSFTGSTAWRNCVRAIVAPTGCDFFKNDRE